MGSNLRKKLQPVGDSSIKENEIADEEIYAIDFESDFPELPDETVSFQGESSSDFPDDVVDPDDNPDKDYLLDIFLGETDTKTNNHNDADYESDQYENYLKSLDDFFNKNERIDTKISFNELKLKVRTDSGGIIVGITMYTAKKEIVVKSYIPYLNEATFDILRLFSHIDFIGSLCVEEMQNQLYFSVRISIDISKYAKSETIGIIEQIVYESTKIEEIIDRHL